MPIKKVTAILVLFSLAGASVGYFLFHSFPDYLLPTSSIEHKLVATQVGEVFVTQSLFSVFFGLAFAAVPLAAFIFHNYFTIGTYSAKLLISMIVMIASILAGMFYYQNYFTEMFAALQSEQGISIKLENIPFYKIPLLSASITIFTAFIITRFRAKNSDY